jgi:hypothetical protein
MPSLRIVAPVGAAAALLACLVGVAVAPAETSSAQASQADAHYQRPSATASGDSGGPLVYPSIVNIRLERAEAALARAAMRTDQHLPGKASTQLTVARANMTAAWAAAKYVIRTAPPPPVAADGAFARSSGAAPAGGAFASPQDTALAVFSLQHDVVTTSVGLLGTGNAGLESAASATIRAAVNARDAAVAYIHQIAPPPPPVAGDGSVDAEASGAPVAAGWSTTMPLVIPLLDDEVQALRGTRATTPSLSAVTKTFLRAMTARDVKTKNAINGFWPPVVGDG